MFSIFLSNKAKKQYRDLESKMYGRVTELFQSLEDEPVPASRYDTSKVEGREESYRIRLSSFRVVYRVNWSEKRIDIAKIERKTDNTY